MMAGGGLFNHLDYSFSVGNEEGGDTTYNAPGSGGKALRTQLGVLRHFFSTILLTQLQPDFSIVTSAPAAYTDALSNKQSEWVIYYEPYTKEPQMLNLQLRAGSYTATWMDAVTGKQLTQLTIKNGIINVPAGTNEKVLTVHALANHK